MTRRPRPERKRDLQGLLGQEAADLSRPQGPAQQVPLDRLRAGTGQPRREFGDAALQALAASIRESGVLQPLLVRPVGDDYEIVAGERRWRAARLAGLTEVPVTVRELTDQEARHLALIENLQREDLNTLDEVDAKLELIANALGLTREGARVRLMQLLREAPGPDHASLEALFEPFGEQWTSFARNKLKILNWPPILLGAVRGGLPYTLAQMIAQTDRSNHETLVALAQSGVSREALREAIRTLGSAVEDTTLSRMARQLGSRRWLTRLSAKERKELDGWLASMPESVRRHLE